MILVIGGTGFLGSHLLEELVNSGKEVRCTHRLRILNYVDVEIAKEIDWIPADVLDVVSLENAMEGCDQVYNCAGFVRFDVREKEKLQAVNVTGAANVVNACLTKRIKKLVHVSSVAAIGRGAESGMKDESCKWEDGAFNTSYGISKHEGEMEVWRGIGEGLNAVIVNPSLLIGHSGEWTDESSRLIRKIHDGFKWYSSGVNGFVNVQDVAKAMMLLMDSNISGERFILAGENWSYRKLFETINIHFGKKTDHLKLATPWIQRIILLMEKLRGRKDGREAWITSDLVKIANNKVYYDNSKIKKFFPGFEFTSIDQTIAGACAAYLKYLEKKSELEPRPDSILTH